LAITVAQVEQDQIVENVSRYFDDPYAVPAQVELSSGQVAINNSATPSLSLPFTSPTTPTRVFGLAGTIQLAENWGLAPVTDSADLTRLRLFYRCATGSFRMGEEKQYPAPMKPSSGGGQEAAGPKTMTCDPKLPSGAPPIGTDGSIDPTKVNIKAGIFSQDKAPPCSADGPSVNLGTYGIRTIWVCSRKDLDDFLIAILNATPNTTGGGQKPAKAQFSAPLFSFSTN